MIDLVASLIGRVHRLTTYLLNPIVERASSLGLHLRQGPPTFFNGILRAANGLTSVVQGVTRFRRDRIKG